MTRTTKSILTTLGFIAVGAALIVAGVLTFPAGGAFVLMFFGACLFWSGLMFGIMRIMTRLFPPPAAPRPDPFEGHEHSMDNSRSSRISTRLSRVSELQQRPPSGSAPPKPGAATNEPAPFKSKPVTTGHKESSPPTPVIKRRRSI